MASDANTNKTDRELDDSKKTPTKAEKPRIDYSTLGIYIILIFGGELIRSTIDSPSVWLNAPLLFLAILGFVGLVRELAVELGKAGRILGTSFDFVNLVSRPVASVSSQTSQESTPKKVTETPTAPDPHTAGDDLKPPVSEEAKPATPIEQAPPAVDQPAPENPPTEAKASPADAGHEEGENK